MDLEETASNRYARIAASGELIAWSEMRRYLQGRAEGKKPYKPSGRKLEP
jgi:hypothetical protein